MIISRVKGKWLVVELEGRIDAFSGDEFQQKLMEARTTGHLFVALDMQRTLFLSLTSIKLVAKVAKELRDSGGELAMCTLSEKLKRQIHIFGTLEALRIYRSTAELPESQDFQAIDELGTRSLEN